MGEPCEVCGEPACFVMVDVKETDPVFADDGSLFANWERDGQVHAYCATHKREPKETSLPDDHWSRDAVQVAMRRKEALQLKKRGYSFREKLGEYEYEVSFATHAELMAFVETHLPQSPTC